MVWHVWHVLGLMFMEASVCPLVSVCPAGRIPFRGAAHTEVYDVRFCSVVLNFQKCCSFFICEQMFSSRVGRQWEMYWETIWMAFKTVVFFSQCTFAGHLLTEVSVRTISCHQFHPPGTAAYGLLSENSSFTWFCALLGNSLVMVKVAVKWLL